MADCKSEKDEENEVTSERTRFHGRCQISKIVYIFWNTYFFFIISDKKFGKIKIYNLKIL